MARSRRATRGAILAVAVSMVFSLSACSKSLDMPKLESAIKQRVEKAVPGVKVTAVDCPTSRKAKKGDVFTCKVTGDDGSTGVVTVTQTSDKGDVTLKLN